MTNYFMKKLRTATGGLLALILCTGFPALSNAALLEIQFMGLNLVYDGKDIYDKNSLGDKKGGELETAESDQLNIIDFLDENENSLGSFNRYNGDLIYADFLILNVLDIPVNGDTVQSRDTDGDGYFGFFDLFGMGWHLQLRLDGPFMINYDNSGRLSLKGSATTNDIYAQKLPFGLTVGTPITLSFSVNNLKEVKTQDGFLKGFSNASGTGEVVAPTVPEPSVLLLMGSGLVALGFVRIRRRTEGV